MNPRRPSVNRRDLIRRFRSAPSADAATIDARPGSADLIRASRKAMGSFFEVRLPAGAPDATSLACRALDRIDELEAQLTIYNDESEVSRLNATAHLGHVEVEPGLFRLLERAAAIGRETGGAYDVTSGALSLAWGFTRGPRRVPSPEALADARARTGRHLLRFDPERRTLAFTRPGVTINLGSIGKGYAIDEAAATIREHWWPCPALIHGGQSSVYALGSPPGTLAGRWRVALRNPFDPEAPLGQFALRNRGMGTSGASFQRFEEGGRLYGHILDPRTGEPPVSGPASVTVLAPSAAEADALSTAFYLLGPDRSAELLASRPEVGAVFVLDASGAVPRRVLTINVPDSEFEPDTGRLLEETGPAPGTRQFRILPHLESDILNP